MPSGATYDLSLYAPEIGGALLVSTIAFPEVEAEEKRLHMALRLSAGEAVRKLPDGVSWVRMEGAGGIAIPVDIKTLNGSRKALERRLKKRLSAGHLALEALMATERNARPPNSWGGRWNRAAAIRAHAAAEGISDPKNYEHRYWLPSLPVIHLAAAWAALDLLTRKSGEPAPDIDKLISDVELRNDLVTRAMAMESLAAKARLGVTLDDLVKMRA